MEEPRTLKCGGGTQNGRGGQGHQGAEAESQTEEEPRIPNYGGVTQNGKRAKDTELRRRNQKIQEEKR